MEIGACEASLSCPGCLGRLIWNRQLQTGLEFKQAGNSPRRKEYVGCERGFGKHVRHVYIYSHMRGYIYIHTHITYVHK